SRARQVLEAARSRRVSLIAGTPLPTTWRLPEVDLAPGTPISHALIVVQGQTPDAELHGWEGLLPIIERRRGGEAGIKKIRAVQGADLWRAGDKGIWSWNLLAAALS